MAWQFIVRNVKMSPGIEKSHLFPNIPGSKWNQQRCVQTLLRRALHSHALELSMILVWLRARNCLDVFNLST